MLTFGKLGVMGRLGNQLFQIAAVIGTAKKHGLQYGFPVWKYQNYFKNPLPLFTGRIETVVREKHFHYTPIEVHPNMDLEGFFQSEKYFEYAEDEVREAFEFHPSIGHRLTGNKEIIAISVRRGDFIDNPNHYLLPIEYYYLALLKYFDFRNYQIIIFTDDVPYCRVHFECLENLVFAENNFKDTPKTYFDVNESGIKQLAMMQKCDHFIIANSTFSWWGAWLSRSVHKKVVRPTHHFDGNLRREDIKDHYPEKWIPFDHVGKKIDLPEVTFIIPVFYDHADRLQNLQLCVMSIQKYFNVRIIIGENKSDRCKLLNTEYAKFDYPYFHRTKMINEMMKMCSKYVFVWDADVICPPLQILEAVHEIKENDLVYPYDGRFAKVPRTYIKKLEKDLDCGILTENFPGTFPHDEKSVGGGFLVHKDFRENEELISYGPDDREVFWRYNKLGKKVKRIKGQIFHLEHHLSIDSSMSNPHFKNNWKVFDDLKRLTVEQLKEYYEQGRVSLLS